MRIRDSGMPEERIWNGFFDPTYALQRLGLRARLEDVADIGCGYGTFTVAAAKIATGIVHAFDIDADMVAATNAFAERSGARNVRVVRRDFVSEGTDLDGGSVDCVMLFNILHAEDPVNLLREAFRILKHDGTLAMMHWIPDERTPRGPPMSIRPRPEQCMKWSRSAGFEVSSEAVDLPPYHFGLTAHKPREKRPR